MNNVLCFVVDRFACMGTVWSRIHICIRSYYPFLLDQPVNLDVETGLASVSAMPEKDKKKVRM